MLSQDKIEQIYNDLMTKKITWFYIEGKYFKVMRSNKDVEYNNKIIRKFNELMNPNEYKFSEFFNLAL